MGMFDPDVGTMTRPAVQNLLTGDGTVTRPRYKAKLGDRHLNVETGELEQRRYDPDAADYTSWDPDSGKNMVVRGIKFGLIFVRPRCRTEREPRRLLRTNGRRG